MSAELAIAPLEHVLGTSHESVSPAAIALAAIAHPGTLVHLDRASDGRSVGMGADGAPTPRCARLFDVLVALASGIGATDAASRAAQATLCALPFPCALLSGRLAAAAPVPSPGLGTGWVVRAIALVEPLQYKVCSRRYNLLSACLCVIICTDGVG